MRSVFVSKIVRKWDFFHFLYLTCTPLAILVLQLEKNLRIETSFVKAKRQLLHIGNLGYVMVTNATMTSRLLRAMVGWWRPLPSKLPGPTDSPFTSSNH